MCLEEVNRLSNGISAQLAVVLPAAGAGRRMGAGCSKGLLTLAGQPLLLHTLAPLALLEGVDVLVVAGRPPELEELRDLLAAWRACPCAVIPGGAERADSVRAGLAWLSSWPGWRPDRRHFVAIHDAARPLAGLDLWQRVFEAACASGAAIPGLPVVDTLKRLDAQGRVVETVARQDLCSAQTPQIFAFEEILAAHEEALRAGRQVTDDAQVWEGRGGSVQVVPGDRDNLKVTTKADLELAEAILGRRSGELARRPGL